MASFSAEAISLAQETQKKYGVPASVTLAQYALESGSGTSNLATKANNYFGITGSNNGKSITLNGRSWRKYDSMAESFDDHGALLSGQIYSSKTANAKNVTEYVGAIAETYAPSSDGNNNYAGNLLKIIRDNNLTQYDTGQTAEGTGTITVDPVGYVEDKALGIVGKVIKIVSMMAIIILAFVFFMEAFNISPVSTGGKIKKAVEGLAEV